MADATHETVDEILEMKSVFPFLDSTYDIVRRVGSGTFSQVYLGRARGSGREVAIKNIVPTSHPARVVTELRCLRELGGQGNVLGVLSCRRQLSHVLIVTPYVRHDSSADYMGCLPPVELRDYVANLLTALSHIHRRGVLHRDVKPANFLYHRATRRYCLVDFGLAQLLNDRRTDRQTPHTATPHLSSRPCKRKLQVTEAGETSQGPSKIIKLDPSQDAVLSTNCASRTPPKSNRLNDNSKQNSCSPMKLRRTPRKCNVNATPTKNVNHMDASTTPNKMKNHAACKFNNLEPEVRRSPRKFNFQTPDKKDSLSVSVDRTKISPKSGRVIPKMCLDSPSKHTRLAEQNRRITIGGTTATNVPKSVTSTPMATSQTITPAATTHATTPARTSHISSHKTTPALGKQPSMFTGPGARGDAAGAKPAGESCRCYGRGQVCRRCLARPAAAAPRAGTPGFRPPEVLLRHAEQGTAVDMWGCGVVLLCALSGCYPFFRAPDDAGALAELCVLFSARAVRKAAAQLRRLFLASDDGSPLDLQKLCEQLRTKAFTGAACARCRQPNTCLCKEPAKPPCLDPALKPPCLDPAPKPPCLDPALKPPCVSATSSYLSQITDRSNVKDTRCSKIDNSIGTKDVDGANGENKENVIRSDSNVKDESKSGLPEKTDEDQSKSGVSECTDEDKSKSGMPEKTDKDRSRSTLAEKTDKDKNKSGLPEKTDKDRSRSSLAEKTDKDKSKSSMPASTDRDGSRSGVPEQISAARSRLARRWSGQRGRAPLYGGSYPAGLYALLTRLLELDPNRRISAEEALQHPSLAGAHISGQQW